MLINTFVMLYYVVCIVMLSYVMLYYVVVCYVVLCCIVLCYVMLYYDVFNIALLGAAIMCLRGCRTKPRLQQQGDIELVVASSCCPACQ